MTDINPEIVHWKTQRDNVLLAWKDAKATLETAKVAEMDLRQQVAKMLFPEPKKGTQRHDLGGGYAVKLVHKINYKLGDKEKVDKKGDKVPINEQVEIVMEAVEKCGNEGAFLVDRLIKTSYDLSVTEYNQLEPGSQVKKLIDSILITSDGAPTIEIEEPKVKAK